MAWPPRHTPLGAPVVPEVKVILAVPRRQRHRHGVAARPRKRSTGDGDGVPAQRRPACGQRRIDEQGVDAGRRDGVPHLRRREEERQRHVHAVGVARRLVERDEGRRVVHRGREHARSAWRSQRAAASPSAASSAWLQHPRPSCSAGLMAGGGGARRPAGPRRSGQPAPPVDGRSSCPSARSRRRAAPGSASASDSGTTPRRRNSCPQLLRQGADHPLEALRRQMRPEQQDQASARAGARGREVPHFDQAPALGQRRRTLHEVGLDRRRQSTARGTAVPGRRPVAGRGDHVAVLVGQADENGRERFTSAP
jgi:hypothetical protein